ncbi:hypothetical protein PtB15_12B526 [Puccinia triticina]|nr:hypothetical protein PtB15_12B526 [Puccinia triticina]
MVTTGNTQLNSRLKHAFGEFQLAGVSNRPGGIYQLLGGELCFARVHHKNLMIVWNDTISNMLDAKLISSEIIPNKWFRMIDSLIDTVHNASSSVDVQLEQAVLEQQDSDGKDSNGGANEEDNLLEDED